MNYIEAARTVIELEKEALTGVSQRLSESFTGAIELFKECLAQKGKIIIIGVGKSGNIGYKIAATLNSTGATAVVLNAQDALHGDLGMIDAGDVILAMSYSGETNEMINLIPFIKQQGNKIVALTSKPESSLGKYASYVLDSSVEKEACPLNLAPTASSTAMLVLGDAIAMVLLEARGFTKDDFAQYHPSGAIGKALLTKVNDIMRDGDQIPTVLPQASVLESLQEMSAKKAGICLIVENDRLCGIFTHGDFVRLYTKDHEAGKMTISEVMTESPVTIKDGLLAVEAVNTLRDHNIDDLVIMGADRRPVGIIDSQDLAKHKLL